MTEPSSNWRVRVRMYCHGLGDCFLLTFRSQGTLIGHMLIDCGVLNPDYTRLRSAVSDICTETHGKIDLLAVTHEHWDHVSGFTQARDLFDRLLLSDVWMAWTEDPLDGEGVTLHKRYDKLKDTLHLVATARGNAASDRVQALLGFSGWDSARFGFSNSTRDALDYVLARMKNCGKGKFCRPGESLTPFGPTVRVHVLGPPRGKLLKKKDPIEGSGEAYELALASGSCGDLSHTTILDYPFESVYKLQQPPALPLVSNLASVLTIYNQAADSWRRIDADWLDGSSELALQMDSYTNNTSLALAIELEGGDVLLFPGDAQVGNWQSWHEINWDDKSVNARQLLSRTILYKAGHHASHNGTLRDGGLELMNALNSVLISTDEQFALQRNPAGSWRMPAKALYAALDQKSNHHVQRSDMVDGASSLPLYMDTFL